MGAALEQSADARVVSLNGPASLEAIDLTVPGDFSSAAFFIVAGCLRASEGLLIRGVGVNPTRTGLLDALRAMGARIETREVRQSGSEPVADIYVQQSALRGIDVAPALVPLMIDEFPILFVAAACARGRTLVRGAEELRHKESDRIKTMANALGAVGIDARELADGLVVEGGDIRGGVADSCGDHRVAMALAVAGLAAREPIQILNTAQVGTSFPGFVASANQGGLRVDGMGSA
jgi:3-phosphoshikimate 1-carboxyvinyltransferase